MGSGHAAAALYAILKSTGWTSNQQHGKGDVLPQSLQNATNRNLGKSNLKAEQILPKPVMSAEAYKIYHQSHSAYVAYKEQEAGWDKKYGGDNQTQDKESVHERLKNLQKRTTDQQQRTVDSKDRGAR